MTFTDFEESRFLGSPVHLYLIRYGNATDSVYAFTDADDDIVFNGITYVKEAISRQDIEASGSTDRKTLDVEIPFNSRFAELYRVFPPSQVVSLTIWQGHIEDASQDFLVVWTGRILQVSIEENIAKVVAEPLSSTLARPGLRRNYQYQCPHVLYGSKCQALRSIATVTPNVLSVNGSRVTLFAGWNSQPFEKYLNGSFTWVDPSGNTQIRAILGFDSANTLRLNGQALGLSPGDSVEITFGCNRTRDDCLNLHNNINNFGGFPWIPTKNPSRTNEQY
jgi:uncharacterized phage protein (TIGR02218 family)